ncbi:MAG: glycosyltransferase, partial [Lachnospiraceae bacterium]|nr:glycosyltransferase [Lachnospiraceae bacterium]
MEKKVENIDISVIVPVYNVEEYLEECLQSLRDQTKKNIEVIIVNDGSTDSSGRIAEAYARKYNNFLYYYKENGGLGCARNYGVKRANGKYIAFMDSDDVVSLDLYEKMFAYAQRDQSELTICNVLRFNSKKTWASGLHKRVFKD